MTAHEARLIGDVISNQFGASSGTPILTYQSNPMNALQSSSEDCQGPLIYPLYNRMIERSSEEEGPINLDNGTASNNFARHHTANLLENGQSVESFINTQIRTNSEKIGSPFLVRKYD